MQSFVVIKAVKALRICKYICRNKIKINLCIIQIACHTSHLEIFHSRPFCLCMIENCHIHMMEASTDEMADTIDIFHQCAKRLIKRIPAVCIEMRRAVEIREFFRIEGMWHKMIDSAHHQMIRLIFHQPGSLTPAVRTERLTHGISLLLRIDIREGSTQFCQLMMIELSVCIHSCQITMADIGTANRHLTADIVHTGPILSPECAEVMAQR